MIGDLNGNAAVELGKYHSEEHSPYGTKPTLILTDFETANNSEMDGKNRVIIQPNDTDR